MKEEENYPRKDIKGDKKNLLNTLTQTINPIMKDLQSDQRCLQMPELALRCAQFFHSISQYCVGYYRNYLREEESKKTKFIKKQEKDKSQRGRRGRKRGEDKSAPEASSENKPEPPKKPLTAYIIYFQDKKPMFVERYPSLNLSQLTKLIAKQWKQLSESQKQVYLDRASDDRKRYEEQMIQFKILYGKIYGKATEEFDVKQNPLQEDQIAAIIMAEKAISLEEQQIQQEIIAEKEEDIDQEKQDIEAEPEQEQEDQQQQDAQDDGQQANEGEEGEDDNQSQSEDAEQNGLKEGSQDESQGEGEQDSEQMEPQRSGKQGSQEKGG